MLLHYSTLVDVDEQELRGWLHTLMDRASTIARSEFAAAVESGEYPLNAVTPRGKPKLGGVSLALEKAPPALLLILNEALDPDLHDPNNEVPEDAEEAVTQALMQWDPARIMVTFGDDGWRLATASEPPVNDSGPDPEDTPEPGPKPDDKPPPADTPTPDDTPQDASNPTEEPTSDGWINPDNLRVAKYVGAATVAVGGVWLWLRARKAAG
ncbi:MAG: hypothetical protein ACPG4T_15725 [Nannocystaceae bacterium]